MTKIKGSRNIITNLKDGDLMLLDPESIVTHATNYFSNLFVNTAAGHDFPHLEDVIPSLINDQMNSAMTACPSLEQIKNVIFSLSKDNAPVRMSLEVSSSKRTGILCKLMSPMLFCNSSLKIGSSLITIPTLLFFCP